MQPALVREGIFANIGRMAVVGAVEPLIHHPRDMRELAQILATEARFIAHLEHQGGQQGDEIRIPAALAQSVERALHLPDP